jgi:hypothetical protein
MEVMSFLKAVPAVIGIAGLLTYFVRARKPESDLELANIVQRVRNTFLLLGCAALIMLSVWLIRRPAQSFGREITVTLTSGNLHTALARFG